MEEMGRPPDVPTAPLRSWVEKVQGSNVGGVPVAERVLDDEFVSAGTRLEFPNGKDGEGVITVEPEVLSAMNDLWKHCLIVKVLGRHVPIAALVRKLRELLKPSGGMYVVDLPKQFFLVRFDNKADYLAAVTGGPWRLFGSILMVQAWTPEFDPLKDEIVTTPVWVRISSLPVNLYHKVILSKVSGALGKPLRVDMTTLQLNRARFARVCVEVNLKKPLKGSVLVNGERYAVAYEGLSTICSSCGIYGHLVNNCPRSLAERVSQPRVQPARSTSDGFTEVRRTNRRGSPVVRNEMVAVVDKSPGNERNQEEITNTPALGNVAISNRFTGLNAGGETEGIEPSMVRKEKNKESPQLANISHDVMRVEQGKENNYFGNVFSAKDGEVSKKANGLKGWRNVTPRKNGPKQIKPTRGLIFGPMRGENENIGSGKRLRVESEAVGRAGGVYRAGRA
ncbi:hypothetical protein CARUB_v10002432mg, partial [Capsella rubella]